MDQTDFSKIENISSSNIENRTILQQQEGESNMEPNKNINSSVPHASQHSLKNRIMASIMSVEDPHGDKG